MTESGLEIANVFDITKYPPTCPVCCDAFTYRYQLEWHYQWKHRSANELFLCSECNEAFTEELDFKSHLGLVHKGYKMCHACEKCGCRFHTDLQLRQHHLIHRNERPYSCKICFRYFSKKTSYEQHLLTHVGRGVLTAIHKEHKCRGCFGRRSFILHHAKNRISECQYIACVNERVCMHGSCRTLSL